MRRVLTIRLENTSPIAAEVSVDPTDTFPAGLVVAEAQRHDDVPERFGLGYFGQRIFDTACHCRVLLAPAEWLNFGRLPAYGILRGRGTHSKHAEI